MKTLSVWLERNYLFTIIAEWLACMVHIFVLPKKVSGRRLAVICLEMFCLLGAVVFATTIVDTSGSNFQWILLRVPLYVLFMWMFLYRCCNICLSHITDRCMRAFLTAELVWSICWDTIYRSELLEQQFLEQQYLALRYGVAMLVYGVLFYAVYRFERYYWRQLQDREVSPRDAAVSVCIAASTFLVTTSFSSGFTDILGGKISASHTLIDLIGFGFLIERGLWTANIQSRQERNMIRQLMDQQVQHSKDIQENMEFVNRKYHDMKQILLILRRENEQEEKERLIDDIEREIKSYETISQSGNEILNTIVSNKYVQCLKYQISLNCVLDGALLDDMETVDICTIFGNALDNAVECVQKISETERRLIHVVLRKQQGFVNILFENICDGELQMENGLPHTTKADKEYHGIGMKSILYSVKRYEGGAMTVKCQNGWFVLNIILSWPIKILD